MFLKKPILIYAFILSTFLLFRCASSKSAVGQNSNDLQKLEKWMTGTFSSAEQAAADSSFYNINLEMTKIWPMHKEATYLYVEQALSTKLDAPYRQRVYKVIQLSDGEFASEVFEIPNDDRFIMAGPTPEKFDVLTPDSLVTREGCTVYLSKISKKEFSGATDTDKCKSSLYGASYATSKVQVFSDKIISWDQGWDDKDEQVWGAEKGGYVFDRIK